MQSKDEVKKELLEVVDEFYQKYQLPSKNMITNEEWNSFLNVLEAHFLAHNMMNDYVHAANIVIRRALNLVFISKEDFQIDLVKTALCDLSAFNIYHDEIDAMREEIEEKVLCYNSSSRSKK